MIEVFKIDKEINSMLCIKIYYADIILLSH